MSRKGKAEELRATEARLKAEWLARGGQSAVADKWAAIAMTERQEAARAEETARQARISAMDGWADADGQKNYDGSATKRGES